MAKDDKGNDDKDKKEAGKALEQIRSTFADMRDLHAKLGDHLDNFDKQADALADALRKDNQAEQEKRWKIMQDAQEKIFQIQQDITKNKAKGAEKSSKAIDEYIRS